ncbi:MAG TPA: ABC transporter permease [Candidatus Acidoferrales bacterium]|nr:ABC transporter permease [Candidatus Acidoferrales bacterium]
MRWLSRFFHRTKQDAQLDSELRFHIEQQTADYIAAGMNPDEARRRALARFGGLEYIKEEARDARGTQFIESLVQDVRFALRMLRKSPGFTAVAVLTLALGIAANGTIFGVVSAMLLRKPPFPNPGTLCTITSKDRSDGSDLVGVSAPDFKSWSEMNGAFADVSAVETGRSFTLTGRGTPESLTGDRVTPDYFSILRVVLILGRPFSPSEAQAGNDHVVILSNELWRGRFGADANVIGKTTEIDGEPFTIVGVAPSNASTPMPWTSPQLWTPLVFSPSDLTPSARGNHYINMVVGRLKSGTSIAQAQADMDAVARELAQTYPDTNKGWGVRVLSLQELLIRKLHVRMILTLLMAVVGFVLLIVCLNLAGLLLARGSSRAHELAVRSAIGASRARLIRQTFAESVLVGIVGAALGLLFSVWGITTLRTFMNSHQMPLTTELHLDSFTLLFTLAISLLTTVLFGLLPAIRASRAAPLDAMSDVSRTSSLGGSTSRLRSVLVSGQVCLALVLLAGAGIVMREVVREVTEPYGFNPNHLVVADVGLNARQYSSPAAQTAFFQRVIHNLRRAPGVQSADATTGVLISGSWWNTPVMFVGRPPVPAQQQPWVAYFVVGPDYFRTLQIPLLKGRTFSESDDAGSPVVAIVNQAFADRFFPKGEAIGQRVVLATGHNKEAQIVGVIANVDEYPGQLSPSPEIYECYLQIPFGNMSLMVRSTLPLSTIVPELHSAVWSVDKDQPIGAITTLNQIGADNMAPDEFVVAVMGIFAGLAVALSAIGIYGVIAYSVAERTREIGIRVALGAPKKDVLALILRQGAWLTGIGSGLGVGIALFLPRLLTDMFPAFGRQGPQVALIAVLILTLVSLLATYIPARRAVRVDPMAALRHE